MEGLTRLVTESLARYGLDRPVDYRRLQWSRWFRCESPHSLLCVPSKPGVFALAEDVMGHGGPGDIRGESGNRESALRQSQSLQGRNSSAPHVSAGFEAQESRVPEGRHAGDDTSRMLAVLQFGEDDDMAFVLDRMLSRENPMRARLVSGRCFVRYVVIEDANERRSTCDALNQWLISSGEKATGIGAHFATSLELNVARTPSPAGNSAQLELEIDSKPLLAQSAQPLDSGSATNIHCPQPLPSGF